MTSDTTSSPSNNVEVLG